MLVCEAVGFSKFNQRLVSTCGAELGSLVKAVVTSKTLLVQDLKGLRGACITELVASFVV